MDLMSGTEGQFTNKLLVDISGTIKGFVKNVDIEMIEGKILIHMKLGQSAESYGLSRSESKLLRFETKITIVADEIVSVGKDCIVVSKGKLPPLEEIKKAKMYKAENDSLKIKLNELNNEVENSLRKLKVLKEDKSELEFKLNKMLKMEEEFSELRLKCAKQEGELEASKRFIQKLDTQDSVINPSPFVASESSYKSIKDEIEETFNQDKQNKFNEIMKDEFALFGEEEKLENEPRGLDTKEERNIPANETSTEDNECVSSKSFGKENPFRKFNKEYTKEDDL